MISASTAITSTAVVVRRFILEALSTSLGLDLSAQHMVSLYPYLGSMFPPADEVLQEATAETMSTSISQSSMLFVDFNLLRPSNITFPSICTIISRMITP